MMMMMELLKRPGHDKQQKKKTDLEVGAVGVHGGIIITLSLSVALSSLLAIIIWYNNDEKRLTCSDTVVEYWALPQYRGDPPLCVCVCVLLSRDPPA